MKFKLTGTDKHNIISTLEFNADLSEQGDLEVAILKILVFLEKHGADFPEEFQDFIEEYLDEE